MKKGGWKYLQSPSQASNLHFEAMNTNYNQSPDLINIKPGVFDTRREAIRTLLLLGSLGILFYAIPVLAAYLCAGSK